MAKMSLYGILVSLILLPIFIYMDLVIIYAFLISILAAFGLLAAIFYLFHVLGWFRDLDFFDVGSLVDVGTSDTISNALSGFLPAIVNLFETLWDIFTNIVPTVISVISELTNILSGLVSF
jgi:phage-related protein